MGKVKMIFGGYGQAQDVNLDTCDMHDIIKHMMESQIYIFTISRTVNCSPI